MGQCFFLPYTQIQEDEIKMPRKFGDKLSLIKVSKGRCPKALVDFSNFSVLCQVERKYVCVMLSISGDFSLFWNIPSRPYWFLSPS